MDQMRDNEGTAGRAHDADGPSTELRPASDGAAAEPLPASAVAVPSMEPRPALAVGQGSVPVASEPCPAPAPPPSVEPIEGAEPVEAVEGVERLETVETVGGVERLETVETVEGVAAWHAVLVGGRLRVPDPAELSLADTVRLTREIARRRAGLEADEIRLRAWAAEAACRENADVIAGLAASSRPPQVTDAARLRARVSDACVRENAWVETIAASELAAAAGVAEVTMQAKISLALELTAHRPATLADFESGDLGYGQLRVILQACEEIQPAPLPVPPRGADPAELEAHERRLAAEAALLETRRDWLESELLAFAPGRTPGRLRDKARRLQAKLGPGALRERVRQARAGRGVWMEPGPDGTAGMRAELHALDAVAMMDRIQRIASSLHRREGEERTMAQLRADVLAALVLGTGDQNADIDADAESDPINGTGEVPGAVAGGDGWANIKAEIMVLLPHEALTGAAGTLLEAALAANHAPDAEAPASATGEPAAGEPAAAPGGNGPAGPGGAAELCGYGPIDAGSALRLAGLAATWSTLYASPDGTALVAMGRARYRPTDAQRRMVLSRDPYCTHPGCRRVDSEFDHVRAWRDGGTTDLENLRPRCPRHHTLKTAGLWTTTADAKGGIEHTSPAGFTYTTTPEIPWATTTPAPPDRVPGTGADERLVVRTARTETAEDDDWQHSLTRLREQLGQAPGTRTATAPKTTSSSAPRAEGVRGTPPGRRPCLGTAPVLSPGSGPKSCLPLRPGTARLGRRFRLKNPPRRAHSA